MPTITRRLALIALAALAPVLSRGDAPKAPPEAKEQPTVMCERGKQILSQDFAGSTLPADWKVAKGKWEVADGVLKGTEVAADMHAAVIRTDLKAHDFIAQVSFKLDGAKQTAFSINNAKGHVCRAVVTPTFLAISKDKAGKNTDDKPAALGRKTLTLAPGEWHTLVVEVHGKDLVASVDGQTTIYGSNDGVDVEKGNFGFPVSGDSASFAHVRVWEAGAMKGDWEANKKKYEAPAPKAKGAAASAAK